MFIIGIFSSVTFVFNFKPCIYPRLTNLDPSLPWGRSLESRNHMSSCVTNQKVQLWRKAVWIPVAETVTSLLNYVTSSFFQSRDSVKKGIQFHFSFPLVLGTKWTHPVFLFEEALVVTWRLKQNISRKTKVHFIHVTCSRNTSTCLTLLLSVQALLNSSQLIVCFSQLSQFLTFFGQLAFKLENANLEKGRQQSFTNTATGT